MDFTTFIALIGLFATVSLAAFYVLTVGLPAARLHIKSIPRVLSFQSALREVKQKIFFLFVLFGQKLSVVNGMLYRSNSILQRNELTHTESLLCRRAGYDHPSAPLFFASARVLTAVFSLILTIAVFAYVENEYSYLYKIMVVSGAVFIGYLLPGYYLRWRTYQRQQRILKAFPEALDLIMICVEAGLGLDASIQRVGEEFKNSCPALHEEFRTLSLELRSGVLRTTAFQNLATRIDVPDVTNVVTTLTQADRFGTSLSEAVRVQADQLRLIRRFKAEERAAKISTKLLFPMIFCLFPSLFLVLVGPAVLAIIENFPRVISP